MEDNRTSIKKRLDDIFIEKMGYLVNRLTNDQRSKSLLSDSAGMQARENGCNLLIGKENH